MKTITLKLSDEQVLIIDPIIYAMAEGESLIAQVYIDGMRLKVLDVETTERVRVAIGVMPLGFGRRYAFEDASPIASEVQS